jgi:hypothetical protein
MTVLLLRANRGLPTFTHQCIACNNLLEPPASMYLRWTRLHWVKSGAVYPSLRLNFLICPRNQFLLLHNPRFEIELCENWIEWNDALGTTDSGTIPSPGTVVSILTRK